MIKNERGDLPVYPTKILDAWKSYFDKLVNVHWKTKRRISYIYGYLNVARSRSKF